MPRRRPRRDDTGLRTVPIGREYKVACLPVGHPLADRASLMRADFEGERVLEAPDRRIPSLEEKFEHIASGHFVALVPQSVARSYSRADLVHLPVTDAEPVETCLAVVEGRRERQLLDFVEIAMETLRAITA